MKSVAKRIFRIIDNPVPSERDPYALLNDNDEIVRVGPRRDMLADWAFEIERADFVRHDEDLIAAETRDHRRLGA